MKKIYATPEAECICYVLKETVAIDFIDIFDGSVKPGQGNAAVGSDADIYITIK